MMCILFKWMILKSGKSIRKMLKTYIRVLNEWGMYIVPGKWQKLVGYVLKVQCKGKDKTKIKQMGFISLEKSKFTLFINQNNPFFIKY